MRNGAGGKHGFAVQKHEVAADAKRWRGKSDLDGIFSGHGAGHQRGAGDDSRLMEFDDGSIHSGRQAEIVGVYNKLGHRLSLSTQAPVVVGSPCAVYTRKIRESPRATEELRVSWVRIRGAGSGAMRALPGG